MKTLKLLVAAIALGITPAMLAQTIKTIYVPKGGALAQMVPQAEANEITHLKLNGKINAIDFRMLRDSFPKLRMLDISQASIGFYEAYYHVEGCCLSCTIGPQESCDFSP